MANIFGIRFGSVAVYTGTGNASSIHAVDTAVAVVRIVFHAPVKCVSVCVYVTLEFRFSFDNFISVLYFNRDKHAGMPVSGHFK